MEEEKNAFGELVIGVPDEIIWKSDRLRKKIANEYDDVIEESSGLKLKPNYWIYDTLLDRQSYIFTDAAEYGSFLKLLSFFAEFTPLSALGWNFLRRVAAKTPQTYILVRNLPFDFGLEQEYLYRCIYAMVEKKTVWYEGKEYIPLGVCYRDKDISGAEQHLYLKAVGLSSDKTVGYLPLYGGRYIEAGRRYKGELGMRENYQDVPEPMEDYVVEFYYNDAFIYLVERRNGMWKKAEVCTQTLEVRKIMVSPYQEECQKWQIDVVTYRIQENDVPGFLLFIRSFGDFARLRSGKMEFKEVESVSSTQIKGKGGGAHSLLNVYNSSELLQAYPLKLPPRYCELEWLYFVLVNYPNFSSIFIDAECQERIKTQIRMEDPHFQRWFDQKYYQNSPRVRDLEKRVTLKYRAIYEAVCSHKILTYGYRDRSVQIFPYTLEYDVMRHLSGNVREAMDVMCYNLDEKRNVKILYKDIKTKDSIKQENYIFSYLDKLYHILAYAIRCASEGKQKIQSEVMELLDHLWKKDTRGGGDNYNRKIRKKFGKLKDYPKEYERLCELAEKIEAPELVVFIKNVFTYWYSLSLEPEKGVGADSWDFQWDYQIFLLSCFTDSCERLWTVRTGKIIEEKLDQIEDRFIWRLISGDEIDGIMNEIAFSNEKMKNISVSFCLRKGDEQKIDMVYALFRNFICVGETLDQERIRFTISYERFYYRRIHMALMALGNIVENIEPAETADIIQKRRENMRKVDFYE